MRASELRGLRWSDVDLNGRQIHVRQRADFWRKIGQPKSAAGTRTIPVGEMVVNTLRQWKLQCPKGLQDLVFPTRVGTVEYLANMVQRYVQPAQVTAGVVDSEGKAKYAMHAPTALLCFLVHQSEGGWWARASAKNRTGAVRTLQHRYDARPLRPLIPGAR